MEIDRAYRKMAAAAVVVFSAAAFITASVCRSDSVEMADLETPWIKSRASGRKDEKMPDPVNLIPLFPTIMFPSAKGHLYMPSVSVNIRMTAKSAPKKSYQCILMR